MNKRLDNYKMLDLFKYIASFMIICIHCTQVFPNETFDFFFRQIVCRIAVPFFFLSSAFFIRKGWNQNPAYLNNYLKKLLKSYLLWSLVFIPIGLNWIQQNLTISQELMPVALLFGLFHIGTYYHLWYIPAMMFSLYFITKLLKHFSYKTVLTISFVLYLFGSLETYYGFIPSGWFKNFFDLLISVIFTTRSGLFYGMIFVAMGFYIQDNQELLKTKLAKVPMLTLILAILFTIEGFLFYFVPGLDMNFFVLLVPFSFFFFLLLLSSSQVIRQDTRVIRELSKYIYFIHPVCVVIVEEIGNAFNLPNLSSGLISLFCVIFLTLLLSFFVIVIHQTYLKRKTVLFSLLMGMFFTSILAGLFYQLKPPAFIVKFEMTSCICFFMSFCFCYLFTLIKLKKDRKKIENYHCHD